MGNRQLMRGRSRPWAMVAVAAMLASCGGDGDGGGVGTVDLTTANRDAAAHAAAAAVFAMTPAGSLPVAASGQEAGRAGRTPAAGAIVARVLSVASGPAAARTAMRRPLAVTGPIVEPCSAGGTVSVTFDDRDNNLVPSAGDVMTLAFSNCRESATETFNGTAVVTYTLVSTSPTPSVGARIAMTQLSMAEPQHSIRLDGTTLLDFRDQGPNAQVTRLTVDGQLTAVVTTHSFSDTVTMRQGFWMEAVFDPTAAPPPGGTEPGRTSSTLLGQVESTAVGGVLDVTNAAGAPIVDYDADEYPRSGALRVTSRTGTVLITALSPAQVRIDLDADDNGTFESTTTQTWDWLI